MLLYPLCALLPGAAVTGWTHLPFTEFSGVCGTYISIGMDRAAFHTSCLSLRDSLPNNFFYKVNKNAVVGST